MLILFSHRFEIVVYVVQGEWREFETDNEGLERVLTGKFKECLRALQSPSQYDNSNFCHEINFYGERILVSCAATSYRGANVA